MKKILDSKILGIIILVIILVIIVVSACFVIFNNSSTNNNDSNINKEETSEPTHADILDEESEVDDTGEQVFFIDKSEVDSFSFTDANGILLDFSKDGNEWICVGNEDLDLDEERVDKVLNYICDIKFVEMYDSTDGAEYGITDESDLFIVEDSGGNKVIVTLGAVNEDGSVYFALNYDFTKVFKNSGKLKNVCEYAIEELLN